MRWQRRGRKRKSGLRSEYFRIMEMLGRVPARMDLFTYMEEEILQICNGLQNSPFKHYLRYLNSLVSWETETVPYLIVLAMIFWRCWRPRK